VCCSFSEECVLIFIFDLVGVVVDCHLSEDIIELRISNGLHNHISRHFCFELGENAASIFDSDLGKVVTEAGQVLSI